jgi:hypothetical protein
MKTVFKTIPEIIENDDCPLPIEVIPNNMGINLCSVEGVSWQQQDDGQITNLTIYFIPSNENTTSPDDYGLVMGTLPMKSSSC